MNNSAMLLSMASNGLYQRYFAKFCPSGDWPLHIASILAGGKRKAGLGTEGQCQMLYKHFRADAPSELSKLRKAGILSEEE
mmetsp:Transcript_93357/g.200326  ORF Transcript_93357/g.200326 Transcript_93357/m.200326 type:complete len:81 (-) Transcript_93357:169-411(-)|eukprot:CAMPEP_0180419418 /NCGR_PEP_ID=MMETSP1036_2-20121128/2083_1 /TAXON_ID=632150 /ORGANISM="Azadinium spinosum, Strain 3D9" /LENGTH=80 /DNA_ID=CAMNT_0022424567 /DNA_START=72 /DNA_END=314 /DNA_ORIENTATION=-